VIHASVDRWLLPEVKMTGRRADPIEGEDGVKTRALRDLEARNRGLVLYRMVFADAVVSQPDLAAIQAFLSATVSTDAASPG